MMVALGTVVVRGIRHPKRQGKIAGKLVFKAPLWTTFLARQKGCSAAGPRPGAASPENKILAKRNRQTPG